MGKKELASNALVQLEKLRMNFSSFQEDCSALLKSIQDDEFVDNAIAQSVHDALENITSVQKQLKTIYNDLTLGRLPQKVTTAVECITGFQQELEQKAVFEEAVEFFKGLHCKDKSIEAIFNEQKVVLQGKMRSEMTVDEAKEELQIYVDFQRFYNGSHELLSNVDKKFGWQVVVGILQDKNSFYHESDTAIPAEPVREVEAVVQEKQLMETEKPEIAAQAEQAEFDEEVQQDIVQADTKKEIQQEAEKAEVEKEIQQETELENKETPVQAENVVDETDKIEVPDIAIDNRVFDTEAIVPDIVRDIEREKKKITQSIFEREYKKISAIGCSLAFIMEFYYNSLANAKWILAASGPLAKTSAEQSINNYKLALDSCQKYGYADKYVCGIYGAFYTLTARGFEAFKYFSKKHNLKDDVNYATTKKKELIKDLMEHKAYELMILYLTFADVVNLLEATGNTKVLWDNFDKMGKFWLAVSEMRTKTAKVSALTIAFSLKEQADVQRLYAALLEHKERWQAVEAIILIGFNEAGVKVFANWLDATLGAAFSDIHKYYYNFAIKQVCSLDGDHIVRDLEKLLPEQERVNSMSEINTNEAAPTDEPTKEHSSVEETETNVEVAINVEEPLAKDTEKLESEIDSVAEKIEDNTFQEREVITEHEVEHKQQKNVEEDSKRVFSAKEREEYLAKYKQLLKTGKTYCASAYLKRLADLDSYFKNEYLQLAYAVNDPLAECNYTSNQIVDIFFSDQHEPNRYYMIAAMLRNFYYNQCSYDYYIDMLMDYIAKNELLTSNAKLKHLVDILGMFKKEHHCGMDKYADYKHEDSDALKQKLKLIAQKAAEQQKLANEQSSKMAVLNPRIAKTLEHLFKGNSDNAILLDRMIDQDIAEDSIKFMKEYLIENFVKDEAPVAAENINSQKINDLINEAWKTAGKQIKNSKKTSQLVSALRTNIYNRLEEIATLMCKYVKIVEQITADAIDDQSIPAYQKACKEITSLVKDVIVGYKIEVAKLDEDYGYKLVLLKTLKEISSKMNGKPEGFVGKYFYLPFLGDDNVILNDKYQPEFRDIQELPVMSTLARIEKHAFASGDPGVDVTIRLQGIKDNNADIIQKVINEDNYGSLRLLVTYINDTTLGFADEFMKKNNVDLAIDMAKSQAGKEFRDFSDDLELYQSYGQIDNTEENKKEIILQTAAMFYENAQLDDNYGFFKKILNEFRRKIQQDAIVQGDNLKHNLETFLEAHPEFQKNEAASMLVERIKQYIDKQKYSAAEELLNRLENNDYDNFQEFEMNDYLQEFLSHYEIYINAVRNNDKTLRAQVKQHRTTNKDTRAAERLINAWPKGSSDATEQKVKELLSALFFNVATVQQLTTLKNKMPNFVVKLQKAVFGGANNYNHPVPAFGSLGETDGFRVVYIFGSYDAERLIEIFNSIGDDMHTLIILDCALKESVRRRLALLVKGKANGRVFAVLDRVVMKYLHDTCSEQTLNKQMLHVIMPYTYYQPYVAESSKPMPSELFIGRKDELKKIKDPNGVNIVYGGRQLGKSALLVKAKKDIDKNESGDRAVYVDIKGLNYKMAARKISNELVFAQILEDKNVTDDWQELAMSIRRCLMSEAQPIHYFLLLLDEADAFLNSCKEVQYRPFDALKDIQAVGEGRFKFVVAGLRDVVRFDRQVALDDNSVLPQLSSMTVKPFKYAEAKELLEYPLSYLGFRFKDDLETDTLVSAILSHTNSFPGMIQLYCTKLIEAMKNGYAGYKEAETPPYFVSEEHIKKVLGEKSLQDEIRQKFFITLKVGDDNYYLLIAMITAYLYNTEEDGISVTPADVLDFANEYEIHDIADLDIEKVTALMEEMRELNVLQHNGEHGYRFTHFSFFQMMGTKDSLEEHLFKYMGGTDNE